MYYEIYLDVVFLINFTLDFIVIKITGGIAKRRSTLIRCISAAAFSSFVLCFIYVYNIELLVRYYFPLMFIMNLATVYIIFYHKKTKIYEIVRLLVIYYIVSFVLGGIINLICTNTAAGYYLFTAPWWGVCLTGVICMVMIRPIMIYVEKCRKNKSIYYETELHIGDRAVKVNGLLDTGNHLREPVSGKPVHVAELSAVAELLPAEFVTALRAYYENEVVENGLYLEKGIRMVPFHAVGTPENKLLVAVTADVMKVKNEPAEYEDRNVYIALYDGKLASDGSYRILLHGTEVIKERR